MPGLDRDTDEAAWTSVAGDPAHPQHTMARLLLRLGVTRDQVVEWETPAGINESGCATGSSTPPCCPPRRPNAGASWRIPDQVRTAFAGVSHIEAETRGRGGRHRLLLREALEVPERRAALVTRTAPSTPGGGLALGHRHRRLGRSPPVGNAGWYLPRLTAATVWEHFAPVGLLSCLKHLPLPAGTSHLPAPRKTSRSPPARPRLPSIAGLRAAAQIDGGWKLSPLFDRLEEFTAPFTAAIEQRPLGELLENHLALPRPQPRGRVVERLWAGEEGEVAADFVIPRSRGGLCAAVGRIIPCCSGPRSTPGVRPFGGTRVKASVLSTCLCSRRIWWCWGVVEGTATESEPVLAVPADAGRLPAA